MRQNHGSSAKVSIGLLSVVLVGLFAAVFAWLKPLNQVVAENPSTTALSLVVMDPLAAPLSCPCVEGYAQRKYEHLAEYLQQKINRPVQVTFAESLEKALAQDQCQTVDLIIGKDSVVRFDSANYDLDAMPIAQLTGKDGKTTQTGLIVVPSEDPAQSAADLNGYRIVFGPAECDEKFSAARQLLTNLNVKLPAPEKSETSAACSDGACNILEWGSDVRGAAVISSYAAPLLEGCGTVEKGDLRVVATTDPVPFVTAFTTNRIDRVEREAIQQALLQVVQQPELLLKLETLLGFVPLSDDYLNAYQVSAEAKSDETPLDDTSSSNSWPGWRGPNRDGIAPMLPSKLPTNPNIVWQQPLLRSGLGGVAATDQYVVIGDRDIGNLLDVFRCYSAVDGESLWEVFYPAQGQLDYDNAPRATPLIHDDLVFLFGAFGDLTCAELSTGQVRWRKNILTEFAANAELIWGTCSSPLLVDDLLIVNPGAADASLVALQAQTGEVVWQSPGAAHAYASPVVATLGGVRQIIAYDRESLGGWDIATGQRLWKLAPPLDGDFNVPTPIAYQGKLLVTSENNGTRLYDFDSHGKIVSQPVATSDSLSPDMSTPVVVGDRLYCVNEQLYCLDIDDALRELWVGEDDSLAGYGTLIGSPDRLLAVGRGGKLLLINTLADDYEIVSQLEVFQDEQSKDTTIYSHPALVGSRLYLRGEKALVCIDLNAS